MLLSAVRPRASQLFAAAGILALPLQAQEASSDIDYTLAQVGGDFHLTLGRQVGTYFKFQYSLAIDQPFTPGQLALGDPEAIYIHTPAPGETQFFVRIEPISVFAPRDSDGDGMDDLWELGRSLDPLNPADAALPSPNIAGITNLEEYRLRFGLSSAKPQYYGREVSLFNYGAPTAAFEAISREWSVFNLGANSDVIGREVSVFNGERHPVAGFPQLYSREQSVFNFGAPPFQLEVLGRELSVFNGDHPPTAGYSTAYSREMSAFNHGAPTASSEAISRELSVFNNVP